MKIMMNKYTTILAIIALSVLAACSSKKLATTAPADNANTATNPPANVSMAEMEEGKAIWHSNCAKCHALYDPASRTVSSWNHILPIMTRKAKLDETQAAKVSAYVLTFAKKG